MKNFIKKCALFFAIIAVLFVPFSVILDPYNVFHPQQLVNNGVEPNKNFIKPYNVIKHMDDYDSLLFGSSRVGFLDVSAMNDGVYYDMMASEGLPAEHLSILKSLIKRGFIPKNVIIGVDDISYFVDPSLHENILYRKMFPWDGSAVDKLGFYMSYLDPITNFESIETMMEHTTADPDWGERLLTTGTENLDIISDFNVEKNLKPYWADYYMPRPEVFDELREIKALCDEYDINLRVFTNPLFGYTYMRDIENGYLVFLEELAEVTPYYNFSGFNDMTMDTANYYENSHYTRAIGDKMIECMYEGRVDERLLQQGFGFYVTSENKEELIRILEDQAINYDLPVNTYEHTLNKSADTDAEEADEKETEDK